MDSIYEKVIDILLAVAVFFIFSMLYFGQKQDTLTQQVITTEISNFLDNVSTQGYLNKDMYESLLTRLDATNILYDISLEHKVLTLEPEYRLRTPEEVIEAQNSSYTGTNNYTYREVITEKPIVTDTINDDGNLNTETNESVLAKAVNSPTDPSHTHSEACYLGHRHTDGEGVIHSTYQHGCYNTPFVTNGQCTGYMYFDGVYNDGFTGHYCSKDGYPTTTYSYGYVCGTCGQGAIYHYDYACQRCGNTDRSGSAPTSCLRYGTVTYYICNLEEDVYVDCTHIVKNITPTHANQTVYTNDPLITTVTATYLDGSTKVVVGSSSFQTTNVVQNQTVTISYSYEISGITYTKTCNIVVTVIPRNKTCTNGHTYNLSSNGIDPGCPYCKAWLKSLTISNPTTGNIIIYKGTTLQDNGVTLLAVYLDGHTETLATEYIDNLDTQYVGNQNVTISYKGKYVSLFVTTKRNLVKCNICGLQYELYPDGTDPGCPYCAAKAPIFTGNVLKYYSKSFSSEILDKLYNSSDAYYFKKGDFLSISVSNKSETYGTKVYNLIMPNAPNLSISVKNGGRIRDEAY